MVSLVTNGVDLHRVQAELHIHPTCTHQCTHRYTQTHLYICFLEIYFIFAWKNIDLFEKYAVLKTV